MKRIVKLLSILLVVIFIITYFNRNNYYENSYVLSEYSNIFIKVSKSIEVVVNKTLKKFLGYLEN